MIAITSLIVRPRIQDAPVTRPEPARPETVAPRAPSLCYEVLIPYTDSAEASVKGLPADARLSMIVAVWAPSAALAQKCALERFRDHRARARSARIAAEGPIPLRVVREEQTI